MWVYESFYDLHPSLFACKTIKETGLNIPQTWMLYEVHNIEINRYIFGHQLEAMVAKVSIDSFKLPCLFT